MGIAVAVTPPSRRWRTVRGGSSSSSEEEEAVPEDLDIAGLVEKAAKDERRKAEAQAWILEQIRRRQQRLGVLSESLAKRGLPFASIIKNAESLTTFGGKGPPKPPQWVCMRSTTNDPKTCLIWGDAEPGTKVIRPRLAVGDDKWVSLGAFNGLRRRDPVKASRLWFDQFILDMRRFSHEAGPLGIALGTFLESPNLVRSAVAVACVVVFAVVRVPLQFLLVTIFTSNLFWRQYTLWSTVVHAPLPLKLLIARQTYLAVLHYFALLEKIIINFLVDIESELFERTALPLPRDPKPPKPHDDPYEPITDDDDDDDDEPEFVMDLDVLDRARIYAIDQIFSKKAHEATEDWF